MARDIVTAQKASVPGAALTMGAVSANNDVVPVGRNRVLVVHNGGGSALTVTVQTPIQVEGLDVAENAINVAAGAYAFVLLDPTVYARPIGGADGGQAYVDYSATASVTRAVIES